MQKIELSPESISAAAKTIPPNTPIVMLNLLRYRDDGGRQAYFERYVPAFNKVAASTEGAEGVHPVFVGNVCSVLLAAPDERWDDVALVEYPSFDVFRRIVESPDYLRDAAPHRHAALAAWHFIAMVQMKL